MFSRAQIESLGIVFDVAFLQIGHRLLRTPFPMFPTVNIPTQFQNIRRNLLLSQLLKPP